MSFFCQACGNQSELDHQPRTRNVCNDCRPKQAGQAALLLSYLLVERRRINMDVVLELEQILDEAQNGQPDGGADGSIDEHRWRALRTLVDAARAYEGALDSAQLRGTST